MMRRADYKILHCADLHLDSPLRGLEAHHDAPRDRIRDATRGALTNIVDLAIAERVAIVLIAGDIYDGDHKDSRTSEFFIAALKRLVDHGIHVVAISGNHDADSVLVHAHKTRWPAQGDVCAVMLPTDRAGSVPFPDLGLVVHGRGFAARHTRMNLVVEYPEAQRDTLNIGLLHTSASGSADHGEYAPCEPAIMAALGYDYWALGHIHARSAQKIGGCWIVFPGNPQGRHARETGEKGVTIIDVQGGRIAGEPRHHTLDVVRWARIEADLGAAADLDGALAIIRGELAVAIAAAAPRLLAARMRLHGASPAHAVLLATPDLRDRIMGEAAAAGAGGQFWLEKLLLETRPATAREPATPLEALLHERIHAAPSDPALAEARKWARDVLEKFPPLRTQLDLDGIAAHPAMALVKETPDQAALDGLLAEARSLLLARLGA